eukprot:TRINITY_DN970_c0_g1_i1.p1 TRINITY_DN970_c0_g1~~TRINITY_DN970_c0_g1_i1.p1  ORF type:complete len:463 (+),score=91.85 TRINITY_DN970_c0_g1_i1:240-1628(+)
MADADQGFLNLFETCMGLLAITSCGIASGWLGLFSKKDLVPMNKFVFLVALPALIFKSLATANWYNFSWEFILAFLFTRMAMGVIIAVGTLIWTPCRSDDAFVLEEFITHFISGTWMSTVIYGVPILVALYGIPTGVATLRAVLATLSSVFFQLPFMLMVYEVNRWMRKRRARQQLEKDLAAGGPGYGIGTDTSGSESSSDAILSSVSASSADSDVSISSSLDSVDESSSDTSASSSSSADEGGADIDSALANSQPDSSSSSRADNGGNVDVNYDKPSSSRRIPLVSIQLWLHRHPYVMLLTHVLLNPVIFACICGAIWSLSKADSPGELPITINQIVTPLGNCVTPMAVYMVGIFIWVEARQYFTKPSLWMAAFCYLLIKHILVPSVAAFFLYVLDQTGVVAQQGIYIAATPLSVAAFTVAHRYGVQTAPVTMTVALGNLTMVLWMGLTYAVIKENDVFAP